jgi:hypothetical protein
MFVIRERLYAHPVERHAMDLQRLECSNFILGLWVEFRQVSMFVLTAVIFEHIG